MDPYLQLATMSRWYVVSRAIHSVARLGIANYMSTQTPINSSELAQQTSTKADLLERLLDFLCAYQLFKKKDGGYLLTELSAPLRDDDPHSLRAVLSMVDEYWWQAFSQMEQSIRTGAPAFNIQHHDDFFDFLQKDPLRQANFDRGMAKLSTLDDPKISQAYDFSQFKVLVDMGGGLGGLCQQIHNMHPSVALILFDTPQVIRQFRAADENGSIVAVAGDFLKTIPKADAYIFKGVLHDFDDQLMVDILTNCRKQMPDHARLLIAEQVMPDDNQPHPNKTMDIVMMTLLGGRQRHLSEWQTCIQDCGYAFKNAYPTDSLFMLMEFVLK